MDQKIDKKNLQILSALQLDASLSIEQLAESANLSRNACWRRVKTMEASGLIKGSVTLLDPEMLGLPLSVLVLIRTNQHDRAWLEQFKLAMLEFPEIVAAYRMSGDLDYVLKVRVGSVQDYDQFYKRLIAHVVLSDVSASFIIEEIKETTALPLKL